MGKNLKDLIDKAEEEDQTRAQLEKTVENLELKVAKLETKLKENQASSKRELVKQSDDNLESKEIILLKDIINSQNQELSQRILERKSLQQNIDDLNNELTNVKESVNDSVKDQIIMKTQNSLNNLIEDYGRLENTNISLNDEISRIENENKLLLEDTKKIQTESSNVKDIERDLKNLNKQLNDLEREKKLLEEINSTFRNKEISVEELEKTIEVFKINNLGLKKENQKLSKIIEIAEAERSRLAKFEEKVSYLENKIIGLREENEKLKPKDAILLAKTINVMEKETRDHLTPAEELEVDEKILHKKEEEVLDKSTEVVQSDELQSITRSDFYTTETGSEIPKVVKLEDSRLDEVVSTNSNEDSGYRKKICPNCGNTNKAQIREIDDKTRVIFPGFYAKKYMCGQCATEWR
ncbi:MAG: hypothetical protein KGD67_03535 [Candidatus Lokiarchaeota archaeon]|nr:hypothetical protein [Candidatus Lokiarchaeota archaeon]